MEYALNKILNEANRKRRHFTKFDDEGKYLFAAMLPHAVACFTLPFHEWGDYEDPREISEGKIAEALDAMPFPCIRIKRRISGYDRNGEWPMTSDTDVIVGRDTDTWIWAAYDKVYHQGKTITLYTPNTTKYGNIAKSVPQSLKALIDVLSDRKNRYIDMHVSRPVRRAEGLSPDYREYVVVRPTSIDERRDKKLLRLSDVFRCTPKLHAVRGHLRRMHERHLRDGRVVKVSAAKIAPHARGKGDLLQVKDYIVK